jgi:hypothetical protein
MLMEQALPPPDNFFIGDITDVAITSLGDADSVPFDEGAPVTGAAESRDTAGAADHSGDDSRDEGWSNSSKNSLAMVDYFGLSFAALATVSAAVYLGLRRRRKMGVSGRSSQQKTPVSASAESASASDIDPRARGDTAVAVAPERDHSTDLWIRSAV